MLLVWISHWVAGLWGMDCIFGATVKKGIFWCHPLPTANEAWKSLVLWMFVLIRFDLWRTFYYYNEDSWRVVILEGGTTFAKSGRNEWVCSSLLIFTASGVRSGEALGTAAKLDVNTCTHSVSASLSPPCRGPGILPPAGCLCFWGFGFN